MALANQRKLGGIVAEDLVFDITTSGVLLALSPLVPSEASLGIAFFPEHGTDVHGLLLQRADVTMYLAKQARSGYEVYTSARDHNSRRRARLPRPRGDRVAHQDRRLGVVRAPTARPFLARGTGRR